MASVALNALASSTIMAFAWSLGEWRTERPRTRCVAQRERLVAPQTGGVDPVAQVFVSLSAARRGSLSSRHRWVELGL